MAKLQIFQGDFSTGEITDHLLGRVESSKYKSGAKIVTNFMLRSHGPAYRRGGFKYKAEVKDHTKTVGLFPFEASEGDSLMLEFGENYIRFFTNDGQVLESDQTITGITAANPGVVTTGTHGYSNGDHVYITGVVGMTEVNNPNQPYVVANKTATTFELTGVDTSAFTAYSSGGTVNRIYEVTTTYTEAQIPDIQIEQSFNTVFITHPSHFPASLVRTTNTDWTWADTDIRPVPTLEIGYSPGATLTPAATTGTGINFTVSTPLFLTGDVGRQLVNLTGVGRASITAHTSSTVVVCEIVEDFPSTSAIGSQEWKIDLSPIDAITPSAHSVGAIIDLTAGVLDVWRSDDIGRYVVLHNGICQITAITTPKIATAEVLKELNSDTATASWTIQDPVWSAARGYPRALVLWQQRLWLFGTDTQPLTMWGSNVGFPTRFGEGTDDSDAVSFDIDSKQANLIQWAEAGRELIIGTEGSEVTLSARTGPVTASNVDIRTRTYRGSSHRQALLVNNEIVFAQKSDRKVRAFQYSFDSDGYEGEDLTYLAEHITAGKIKDMAYQQDPDEIIWMTTQDGDLLTSTFKRDQSVIGWSKHTTDGTFENVQTISSADQDQVWVVVKRTINGDTKRYIELWENEDGTDPLHSFSDSSLTYSVPLTITAVTKADPGVVTSAAHGLVNGDHVRILGVVGMTELNNAVYQVANKTTNTFELNTFDGDNVDTSAFTTYVSDGFVHKMVTTISGLDHLEGEVVQVKLDGAVHTDKTVSSGAITLDIEGAQVVVGLPYTSTITTLEPNINNNTGSMQGQPKRWTRVFVRVNKSAIPTVNLSFIPSRKATDAMNSAVPLFTGDLEYGGLPWGVDNVLTVTISQPLPFELVAIFGVIETNVA